MSTTIVDAHAVLEARAKAVITGFRLLWAGGKHVLPNTPEPFIFFDIATETGKFIETGSGRASNRYRTPAELQAYVFLPKGQGMKRMLTVAEPVAAAFRRFNQSGVTCRGGTVHPLGDGEALTPPGMQSAAGNYGCVVVAIPLTFDQTT